MPDKRPKDYVVVDDTGEVWEPAKTIRKGAKHAHTTPKKVAKRDAAAMTMQAAGTTFHAIPAKPKKEDLVTIPGTSGQPPPGSRKT